MKTACAPPILISAEEAARLCGISRTTWWTLNSAGRTPAPVKLGGRTLWKRAELLRWVDAGCPPRNRWEATQ